MAPARHRAAPQQQNLSLKLIWSLAHEPIWFGGVLAVIVGFLLQASALGNGELSVVEPILVLELPATLILASRVFRTRMHKRYIALAVASGQQRAVTRGSPLPAVHRIGLGRAGAAARSGTDRRLAGQVRTARRQHCGDLSPPPSGQDGARSRHARGHRCGQAGMLGDP